MTEDQEEHGGYGSQDDLALVSVFDSLGYSHDADAQERIEQFKQRGVRGLMLRRAFGRTARAFHEEYAEKQEAAGRPVLGFIKWLIAHPQVVLTIVQIVLMIL